MDGLLMRLPAFVILLRMIDNKVAELAKSVIVELGEAGFLNLDEQSRLIFNPELLRNGDPPAALYRVSDLAFQSAALLRMSVVEVSKLLPKLPKEHWTTVIDWYCSTMLVKYLEGFVELDALMEYPAQDDHPMHSHPRRSKRRERH